jgi:hypothetical protein
VPAELKVVALEAEEAETEDDAVDFVERDTTRLELALSKLAASGTADPEIVDPEIADPETLVSAVDEPENAVADAATATPLAAIQQAAAAAVAAADWREDNPEPVRRRPWPWAVGAGLLTLTLAVQLIHAARSELAGLPGVGPIVIAAYATLGREVAPPVALEQYRSLDLTAYAEPAADEHGSLKIETRVQNRGPKVQPYPYIFVRIRDRWEETIAGRYFAPGRCAIHHRRPGTKRHGVRSQFLRTDRGHFCLRLAIIRSENFRADSFRRDMIAALRNGESRRVN